MGQLEVDAECKVCKGTGIYVGFAERDKAGIKCHDCNGTGKRHLIFDWTEFKERNIHPDIDWVYENNPGVVVGTPYAEYGGMPYSEFLKGNPFPRKSEGRSYNCPAWWYQSID
jgi:hypothetical protein